MGELTLEWSEQGRLKTQVLSPQDSNKMPGTIRVGRDPDRCDLVLSERSVSGLHIEIVWHSQAQRFYVRNLRATNPPVVDQAPLAAGERPLQLGSTIQLGRMLLKVTHIEGTVPQPPETVLGGLQCPNPACRRVSSYQSAALHCCWCGFSLAGAETVLGGIPGS